MQIVIDIPEERYDEIYSLKFVMYGLQSEENRKLFYRLINAVQDGTVLPEHGRLKDVDEILDKLLYMGYMDEQKSEIEDVIEMLPTILEANMVEPQKREDKK